MAEPIYVATADKLLASPLLYATFLLQQIITASTVYGHYEKSIDRESAYQILKGRTAHPDESQSSSEERSKEFQRKRAETSAHGKSAVTRSVEVVEAFAKSAARSVGTSFGRQFVRGILGSIFGGTKKR